MKFKLGLLKEPIANPVDLMEIYRKVMEKQKHPEEQIITITIPPKLVKKEKRKYESVAWSNRSSIFKIWHKKYDENNRLRMQIFRTMSNRVRCPRCNQVYFIKKNGLCGKRALKKHNQEVHAY